LGVCAIDLIDGIASLMFEGRLDSALNFLSWKARVTLLLEENDLWDIVKDVVPLPTDPQELVAHKKKEAKAKWIILDAIKDHLIPHISERKTDSEGDIPCPGKSLLE
jgi:hypothetical protein